MQPTTQQDVDFFQKMGMTLLPSFLGGRAGVIARYDLPKLFFSAQTSRERLDEIMDKLNRNLRSTYSGCGYYGSSPSSDDSNDHVFVLFTDDEFYDDYLSGSAGNARLV